MMLELVKRTMLTGIGLALVAKDELVDLAKDIEKKMEMSETDGKKFLDEVKQKYDETQEKLEGQVEKTVKEILKKMDVVTGDEIKGLKKEIRDLKKAISKE
ncbi:MAG: phasin family protein [Deltaproteobacteria bacterium]|nr:phasin family protein [Deltaproteobacteria bacterium]MBW1813492.1 phasin family protein [Deltaproteobacteria bacterium]MBW1847880.1 phasin family protein [Deltaproteobacteria bacterium]MBW2180477.1 phasin family protein [Deltaproteobacteria bacterium]